MLYGEGTGEKGCCRSTLEDLLKELTQTASVPFDPTEAIRDYRMLMSKRLSHPVENTVALLDWLHQHKMGHRIRIVSEKAYQALTTAACRDSMTGLYNHRFFRDQLDNELRHSLRKKAPLSILLIDLDNFKAVNDKLGHQIGDGVLFNVGQLILSCLRELDYPCRYGGDEIAVILPETGKDEAMQIAERIRNLIETSPYTLERRVETIPALTASIGIATAPMDAATGTELIGLADQALYRAKRSGKNRVVLFSSEGGDSQLPRP